jgi:hypothetical protein
MDESKAVEAQGVHYFQAAQRLGISVQHLMQLERSGTIDPPASLERGQGRFYTQAELDAVADRLASEAGPREGVGIRAWWLAAAGALLIALVFAMTRSPAPLTPEASEKDRAAASELGSRKPEAELIDLGRELPEAGEASEPPEPAWKAARRHAEPYEPPPELREGMEKSEEDIKKLHERGIFY